MSSSDPEVEATERGFTALEAALIREAIPFAGSAAGALAEQFAKAIVVSRDLSGVGSFAKVEVPPGCSPVIPVPSVPFSPVGAQIGEAGHLLSSILWFAEGKLVCVELHLLDPPESQIDLATVKFTVESLWPLLREAPTLH